MIARIADLSITNALISNLQQLQRNMTEKQFQVSTEKVSDNYAGIASDSQRLINLENTSSLNSLYIRNNEIIRTRLELQIASYESAETSINDMRNMVDDFIALGTADSNSIDDLQDFAFKTLQSLEATLNSFIDGQYLFSGSKTHTAPVDFNLSSLSDFQAKYDGDKVTYPTTRDAHLSDISFSADTQDNTDWLTFSSTTNVITSTTSSFGNVVAGSTITVSGTASNDGSYTVANTYAFDTSALDAAPTLTLPDTSTLTAADFGTLSFANPVTITAATASSLSGLNVGDEFTISGATDSDNDGTYTVATNDGTTLTVVPSKITLETPFDTSANDTAPTLTVDGVATLTSADFTDISFTDPNTIVAAAAGSLAAFSVGDIIEITDATDSDNNGSYTITANDGTTLTVDYAQLTDEGSSGSEVDGSIVTDAYYDGDYNTLTHRVDKDFTIDMDVTAAHPAFEKAIRAMGILMQGVTGTSGGLDYNVDRAEDARWLLDSALDEVTGSTPPYGTEMSGDMSQLGFNIAFDVILLDDTEERFNRLTQIIDGQVAEIENVDLTLAIAEFNDATLALQAAYQVYAQASSLSLSDFL